MLSDHVGQEPRISNFAGLNPCSNGICSLTDRITDFEVITIKGLNPCSNGICSLTIRTEASTIQDVVLILVLMEYAL